MREVELKFQIAPQRRQALLKALDPKKSQQIHLQARYYDTPEQHLANAQIALRQRLEGDVWVQTLKASISPIERFEHNIELGECQDAPILDLQLYQAHAQAQQILQQALGEHAHTLRLQFATDIQRTYRVLNYGDSEIEVAVDHGEIRADGRIQQIYEVEFELKSGLVQDLLAFSLEWVKKYQLWLDVRSKAEFGQLLVQNLTVSPATVAPVLQIQKKYSTEHHIRQWIAQHLQHLLPNIAALSAGVAEEPHREQAYLALHHLHLSLAVLQPTDLAKAEQWAHQLASFKQLFEHLAHLKYLKNHFQDLLTHPHTLQQLAQDILYAEEKLNNLVRSNQNVQHFLELLMFSLSQTEQHSDLKTFAQQGLQRQYRQLQQCFEQMPLAAHQHLAELLQHVEQLAFSFPLFTQIYDVKNLAKYGKPLQEAQQIARILQDLMAASHYLHESELDASDWFVLGWLAAKQEYYTEQLLEHISQFLLSRKFIKSNI